MAQVQDDRSRLANAYERAVAIVALVSLPTSAFLFVVAPEFIGVVLGPAWTAVVLPFQVFAFSLLFRMSSTISDSLTKAAGAVYARAVRQGVFAALVLLGAFIGQRWGVAGVAVAVSITMALNFLSMAQLSHSLTGLSWSRFLRAHVPGVLLAGLIGGAAVGVVEGLRTAQLGNVLTLLATGLAAAVVTYAAMRLSSQLFMGPHGIWASRHVGEFLLRVPRRLARYRADNAERLAGIGKANPK
jgi:O-antigen/teichoic acid export membrane protein